MFPVQTFWCVATLHQKCSASLERAFKVRETVEESKICGVDLISIFCKFPTPTSYYFSRYRFFFLNNIPVKIFLYNNSYFFFFFISELKPVRKTSSETGHSSPVRASSEGGNPDIVYEQVKKFVEVNQSLAEALQRLQCQNDALLVSDEELRKTANEIRRQAKNALQ